MTGIAQSDRRPARRPLSVWELPKLVASVHRYRTAVIPSPKRRPHHAAIIAFVYRNRLATADQIRRRFPQYLPSGRTARRHLAEMESLGLLAVQPVNNVSPLMPKVYFVATRGLRLLRESLAARGQDWQPAAGDRRRGRVSFQHVWHELATTEFLLSAWEAVGRRPDLELLVTERRSLVRHPAFALRDRGPSTHLQPDALFLLRQCSGGMICCLVEIDTGSETERQLAAKFRRYHLWALSAAGQRYLADLYGRHGACRPGTAFRLLWVVTGLRPEADLRRTQAVSRLVREQPDDLRRRLWITSAESLRGCEGRVAVLEQPLWVRDSGTLERPAAGRTATRAPRHALFPSRPGQ